MSLNVSTGNYWNYWDKEPGTTVYTLDHKGETKEWPGHRYQPEHIFLFGDFDEMADWLQAARDRRLDLHRGEGWQIRFNFRKAKGPLSIVVVELWWEKAPTEDTVGPLPSLGFVFREWIQKNGF